MRKAQLAASKRLEKELRESKVKPTVKPTSKPGAKADKDTKGKSQPKKPQEKKKYEGPLMKAMADFLQQKKMELFTFREAQGMWKTSSERDAITSTLSESERKRRRYE